MIVIVAHRLNERTSLYEYLSMIEARPDLQHIASEPDVYAMEMHERVNAKQFERLALWKVIEGTMKLVA